MKKLLILVIILIVGYFVVDKYYPQYLQKLPLTEQEKIEVIDETAN